MHLEISKCILLWIKIFPYTVSYHLVTELIKKIKGCPFYERKINAIVIAQSHFCFLLDRFVSTSDIHTDDTAEDRRSNETSIINHLCIGK